MPLTTSNEPVGADGGADLAAELTRLRDAAEQARGTVQHGYAMSAFTDHLRKNLPTILAALASTARTGAGDWVTVPREPTPEMLKAAVATPGMSEIEHLAQYHAQRTGKDFLRWPERGEQPPLVQAWKAMLSAVPASPISTGEEEDQGASPSGSGSRPSDQAPTGLVLSGFDPSRDPTGWSVISRKAREASGLTQDELAETYNAWIDSLGDENSNPHQFKAFLAGVALVRDAPGLPASPPVPAEHGVEIRELSEKATPGEWTVGKGCILAASTNPWVPGQDVVVSAAYSDRPHDHDAANLNFIRVLVNAYRSGELIHRSETGGQGVVREGEGRVCSRNREALARIIFFVRHNDDFEPYEEDMPFEEAVYDWDKAGALPGIRAQAYADADRILALMDRDTAAAFCAAPCDRRPAGAETHSGSVGDESAVTGAAGQAPCHWGGGNDIIWCSTCGAQYAYAKGEERPPCPRSAAPAQSPSTSDAEG